MELAGSVIPRLRRPRVCKHGAAFCKHDVHTCFFLLCKHELPQVLPVKYAFTQLPSCLRSISQGADLVHFRSPHVCKHNMSYLTFASRAARVCKQDTCVCKPKAHILSGVCKHKVARGYVSHLAFANTMCESMFDLCFSSRLQTRPPRLQTRGTASPSLQTRGGRDSQQARWIPMFRDPARIPRNPTTICEHTIYSQTWCTIRDICVCK